MNQTDTAHAWWSRLRHQGLLLSPVVMVERYPTAPPGAKFPALPKLRDARTRFESVIEAGKQGADFDQAAILGFTDALLEGFIGHTGGRLAKQGSIPEKLTAPIRIGSHSETIRPHRVLFADEAGTTPAVLVMADTSPQVGRGRGRTVYSRFLELLRGTGHRLGLLTNGQQFRLVYAGLDFEASAEWESDRWFDEGEGTEELCGLRQLLLPVAIPSVTPGIAGLLDAVEESRKRQADLSSVLRENVRQAIELVLDDVSTAHRTNADLFASLMAHGDDRKLSDAEAHEALFQASVRVVMRLVVCLFAESRQLLPINAPIYAQSYGVRSLYERLEEVTRYEGGTHALFNRQTAWHRLMALFRLIYGGSSHGAFPMRPYGGVLFRPGDENSTDAVARALHILEHGVGVCDATIHAVLRKLLRGPLPVMRGRAKTFVEGPVDYTDLRTEFIGLIYEGLLDYRLKRTDEKIGPQVFLNLGREPVLPLARLEDMLANDKKALKDLLTTLRKEKVTASADTEDEDSEEKEAEEPEENEATVPMEEAVMEVESSVPEKGRRAADYLDAVESAKCWAREAVVLAGLVRKQSKKESDSQYQQEVDAEAAKLIQKDLLGNPMVKTVGEFYLVRAGNIRKGTGTHYTRPQLAVPTVHRTLEPLCYDKAADGTLIPKRPEVILGLKVCDSSCGSASFLVAALHYLADALYKSLCYHCHIDDPAYSKKVSLPYGLPPKNHDTANLLPFPPNDPNQGHRFEERVKALLRRHVVERCIYGVDINPLAVELARVSLWVETLDPELPFSFLDHKIKVGNSLVGCWLDRVEDYPLKAWEREGGDGKDGPRTQRIEELLKGEKIGNRRSGDGRIKKEMRQVIDSKFSQQPRLFPGEATTTESVVALARAEYEKLHDLPIGDPDERERFYREHIERSQPLCTLTAAMDEWCAVWFWPTDEESLRHVPTPLTFHKPSVEKDAIVDRLAQGVKFFHWEMEFPDVFTPERCGFDGVLGNPPWEVMKPNFNEFFTEYEPLYRTLSKQAKSDKQQQLFQATPDAEAEWNRYNAAFKGLTNWVKSVGLPFSVSLSATKKVNNHLHSAWSRVQLDRHGFSANPKPFSHQGGADLNSYKLFLECAYHLLNTSGRFGFIVPSGLYTDKGSRELRELFLDKSSWEWLFSFENRKKIFEIDGRFKFAATIVARDKPARPSPLKTAFMVHDSVDWERTEPPVFEYDLTLIPLFSPASKSLPEVSSRRDLEICRTLYADSVPLFDSSDDGLKFDYSREFHMGDDARLFKGRDKIEAKGFACDRFGVWRNDDGEELLPLYEGRMADQFDPSSKEWISGKGRTAKWDKLVFENKSPRPQYLVEMEAYDRSEKPKRGLKIGVMNITSSTNTRTLIANAFRDFPTGDSLYTMVSSLPSEAVLFGLGLLNSLAFDFCLRARLGGLHVSEFILFETPIPRKRCHFNRIAISVGRLNCIHNRFAPEWLRLKHLYPDLAAKEWKHWWAVTEADRLRLRIEIDALVADLYGLDPDDFDWIVRDDPSDPKGFHRVDKHLPFRERLTGLAAAAFRALKEGKWQPLPDGRGSEMTNDEFFALLGIPELTAGPEPLIRKRSGCHVWNPEAFGPDDSRHGWTWEDCWKDAVALLGSEEAVRDYVEGKKEQAEEEPEKGARSDLFGQPLPPTQKKLW